jgi:WXG100 family type VII secretion target
MATLHMDVEAVQGALSKMRSEKEAMMGELTAVTNQVNSTVGQTWQGPSASEFQQSYEQLRSQITQQLDALEQLAQNLQTEIAQWQDTASRLGG